MNNKGFTILEFVIWLFGIIVIFCIVLNMSKGLVTSVARPISDKQVFAAAENYVVREDIPFTDGSYVCVTKKHLERMGYLKKVDDTDKIIKLTRSKLTKVINKIEYVSNCK